MESRLDDQLVVFHVVLSPLPVTDTDSVLIMHPRIKYALSPTANNQLCKENALAKIQFIEATYEVIGDRVVPGEADTMTHTAQALASLETVDPTPAQGRNFGKKSKKVHAQFGRTRTHNEQILVAPCGIII